MAVLIAILSFCIFPLIILSGNLFTSGSLILMSFFLLNRVSSNKSLDSRLGLLALQCSCLPVLLNLSYGLDFMIARILQISLVLIGIVFFVNNKLKSKNIDLKKKVNLRFSLIHNK
ncbi:MAG: hypothetical protein ACRCWM_06765 [Sarcina sp.]